MKSESSEFRCLIAWSKPPTDGFQCAKADALNTTTASPRYFIVIKPRCVAPHREAPQCVAPQCETPRCVTWPPCGGRVVHGALLSRRAVCYSPISIPFQKKNVTTVMCSRADDSKDERPPRKIAAVVVPIAPRNGSGREAVRPAVASVGAGRASPGPGESCHRDETADE